MQQYGAGLLGPNDDEMIAMKVDEKGNIYVTGHSRSIHSGADYVTIKYNPSGEQLWIARFDGKSSRDDIPAALAVDASGNVYVTGSSKDDQTDWDYATVKYNQKGIQQWVTRYNDSQASPDQAADLKVDIAGNVYVVGTSITNGGIHRVLYHITIKYNSQGERQWRAQFDSGGGGNAVALSLDSENK